MAPMLKRFGRHLGATGVIAGLLAVGSPARAVTYTFDNSIGDANNFSVTSGGMTATFTSTSGPGTFGVNPSADIFTFPVALGGFGNFEGDPLTITFSSPVVDRILIPFGMFEAYAPAPVTLVATANTGQSVTFTTSFTNLITGSPEGEVDFVPTGPLSSLTLTSPVAFAIASVDVPEPMSVTLLGGGLVVLALTRRRRD
jgi:hypothetical protein